MERSRRAHEQQHGFHLNTHYHIIPSSTCVVFGDRPEPRVNRKGTEAANNGANPARSTYAPNANTILTTIA